MITWHEELPFNISNPIADQTFSEHAIFFDIETTGFSPARTSLYLIGCATRTGNTLCLDQFFAETKSEESEVILAFFSLLKQYDTIISFNGIGFDIPYLKAKCSTYHIQDTFDNHTFIDLYKEASRIKRLLALPSLKQKSIEAFLGIDRIDAYSGGELIEVYKEYTKNPTKEGLALLRQHNYEDVLDMPKLLPILSYHKLLDGYVHMDSLEANEFKAYDGSIQKELIFTLTPEAPVPKPVSLRFEDCYLTADGATARLCIRLFEGNLRHFFDSPKDYYYLPDEDRAIHKSIATYVDRAHRVQANAKNCYAWKCAIFLPQYEKRITPAFCIEAKDKKSYFELSEDFITSVDMQLEYVRHILQKMSK